MKGDVLEDPKAGDRLLASACRFLADGGNDDLACLLATCSARVRPIEEPNLFGGGSQTVLEIFITAPRLAYDTLTGTERDEWTDDQRSETIYRALQAPIPPNITHRIQVLAELIEPDEDWRAAYGATKPHESPLPPQRELPAPGDDDVF
jgi:hypothetical protein